MLKFWPYLQRAPQPRRRVACQKLIELLEVRVLLASDLFVATTGNDSTGDGTVDSPFLTLAHALSQVESGDSIILREGTYAGGVTVGVANVTIRSFDDEWATLLSPTNDERFDTVIRFNENASGGKIQRLEIIGGSFYGVKVDSIWSENPSERVAATGVIIEDSRIHDTGRDAIKITPGCDDVIIRRNEIYNSGRRDNSNAEGIDNVNGDRMIVQDNFIHDIATNGLYAKGGAIGTIIERNQIENTGEAGIALGFRDTDAEFFDLSVNPEYYENIDALVVNNIVVNTQLSGIALFAARNASITNNTLVDVAQAGHAGLLVDSGETYLRRRTPLTVASRDIVFANNILTQSTLSTQPAIEIREDGLAGSFELTSNRYFHAGGTSLFEDLRSDSQFSGGLSAWTSHIEGDTGSTEGDPVLNDDLHLVSESPCVDAGDDLYKPQRDIDGGSRTGRVDIGADELGDEPYVPGNETRNIKFLVGSSSVTESPSTIPIKVILSSPAPETVTVEFLVSGGTSRYGDDFTGGSGTLTFFAGQTTAEILLTIVDDNLNEADETITLSLFNAFNAELVGNPGHLLTIRDNDEMPVVQFVSSKKTVSESNSDGLFMVKLARASGREVTLSFAVGKSKAQLGNDYQILSSTLTFQPGETEKSLPILIVNDAVSEGKEKVTFTLTSSTQASIGKRKKLTIKIADDDSSGRETRRDQTQAGRLSKQLQVVLRGKKSIRN